MKGLGPEMRYLEALADAVLCCDQEFRIRFTNQAVCRLTGYTGDELENMPFLKLLEDTFPLSLFSARLDQEYSLSEVLSTFRLKDQSRIPVSLSFSSLTLKSDLACRYLIICRDLHHQRAYDGLRFELDQLVNQLFLTTKLAHKLNNPLEIIKNYSYILQTTVEHDVQKQQLTYIDDEISKISELLRHFVLGDPDAKATEPVPDLGKILVDFQDTVRPWMLRYLIRCDVRIPEQLNNIVINREKFLKLLFFLVITLIEDCSHDDQLSVEVIQTSTETCILFMDASESRTTSFDLYAMPRSNNIQDRRLIVCYHVSACLGGSLSLEALEQGGRKIQLRFGHRV
ncbi:PAS domain S-box protein [bacterium]|nr:PAS domain S-box protein [bacterium]